MNLSVTELCTIGAFVLSVFAFIWKVYYEGHQLSFMTQKNAEKAQSSETVKLHAKPLFSFLGLSFFSQYNMRKAFHAAQKISKDLERDGFKPTLIIGIGRGGAIFGSIISYNYHHTPMISIDRTYTWEDKKRKDAVLFDFQLPAALTERVLLVAGEAHTGSTMDVFIEFVRKSNDRAVIKNAVFYKQKTCTVDMDYVGFEGDGAPMMPWQDSDFIRDSLNKSEGERLAKERLS